MADILVEMSNIDEVKAHPNADKLEIAVVKGWQVIVPKGEFHTGDSAVYIPPDAVLPEAVSDHMGVTKYLSKGRVRAIKLRGEPSFGFLFRPDGSFDVTISTVVGTSVADNYGITKYEPPVNIFAGDAEKDHPLFFRYTDIENLRNYPDVFEPGEPVSVSEKIHGTNCRVGVIDGIKMAGSHNQRRKEPDTAEAWKSNLYWYPWTLPHVKLMLTELYKAYKQVTLYGEIYGKVQELKYGHANDVDFAAFDLMLEGKYANAGLLEYYCDLFGVRRVPVIGCIGYNLDEIKKLSEGRSMVDGADNIREGAVIRPLHERTHPKVGRVIMKYVSDTYLCSKDYNKNKEG